MKQQPELFTVELYGKFGKVRERRVNITRAEVETVTAGWREAWGCSGLLHRGSCRFPFRSCDGGYSYAVTKV